MLNYIKYGAAALMLVIGLAAGMTSLTLNVSHGLEKAWYAAMILALADIARMSVPVIGAFKGWSRNLMVAIGALAAFSLFNIASYQANKAGAPIWESMQADVKKAERAAEIANLTVEIAGFAEKRSSATLIKLAEEEKKNKFCGGKCANFMSLADEAARREALEAKRETLKAQNEAVKTVEVKGFAIGFVAMGFSPIAAKTIVDAIEGSFGSLILDMLVYFLIPGAMMLREDRKAVKASSFGIVLDAKPQTGSKAKKDEVYRELVSLLLEKPEYSVLVSKRQLAQALSERLGKAVAKTSLNGWLAKEWAQPGKLKVVEHSAHRVLIGLDKAA